MPNLADSAITIEQYNSRATYVLRNAPGFKGLHRDQEGVLWAAVVTQQKRLDSYSNVGNLDVYKSTDDGFIWNFFISLGIDHYDIDTVFDSEPFYYGTSIQMFDDKFGNLWVARSDSDNAIQLDAVNKSAGTSTNYLYWGESFAPDWADFDQDFTKGQFTMAGDANSIVHMFLISTASDSLIDIPFDFGFVQPRPRVPTALASINWTGALDSVAASGLIHIAGTDTSKNVKSVRMENYGISGVFDSSVTVEATSEFALDVAIDKDGYDTLIVSYVEPNAAMTEATLHYNLSDDDGATYADTVELDKPAGTSYYLDGALGEVAFNAQLIANNAGGFMFSSTFINDTTGRPALYTNEFTTADGSSYSSPSGWVSVASRTDQDIVGGEFFRPMNTHKAFFGNKSDMRMGYDVGLVTDDWGNEPSLSPVFQERLNTNAYPTPIAQTTLTQKNVDFYASGLIGDNTTKYNEMFTDFGTSGHLVQYTPIATANLNAESAFTQETTEYTTDVFFDTISYDRPQVESVATSSLVTATERDIRKVFFRPDFYLERVYTVNDGGFLKRTVWIMEHFGNRYEVTQIVPKFIDDQICYYQANAFVVGPSNNPFTRSVLPSET